MFTKQEVLDMMSEDHRRNTVYAYQKRWEDITPEDLVRHWEDTHPRFHTMEFIVHDIPEEWR